MTGLFSVCPPFARSADIDPEDLGLDDPTFLRTRLPALAEGRTIAFYLNMLWTLRHGQRMTRLEAKLMPGRHGSWAKHENMAEMARDGTCKVSNGFR